MKLSSVSGVVLPVRDPQASLAFYQRLGFRPGRKGAGFATIYLHWFWLELVVGEPRPSTAAIAVKVDDPKAAVDELIDAGLSVHVLGEAGPIGPGRKGIRLVDLDGYQLELFTI